MALNMNNTSAKELLDNCNKELTALSNIISATKATDIKISFLTKYSLIKCSGTLEQCVKAIVYDKLTINASEQTKNHIDKTINKSSMNANYFNIIGLLNNCDKAWGKSLKQKVKKTIIESNLKSLYLHRNDFAHGKNVTCSFEDIKNYFKSGCNLIELVDDILS